MQLSLLIQQRDRLLRQVRIANLAYAYGQLAESAARAARAGLRGDVRLLPVAPAADRPVATLTALDGPQSAVEEFFTDEDVLDLADALAYAGHPTDEGLVFGWEEVGPRFLAPIRHELQRAGVSFEDGVTPHPDSPAAPH